MENRAISFVNEDVGYVSGGIWQGPPPGINSTYLYKTTDGSIFTPVFQNSTDTPIQQMAFFSENSGLTKRWQDNILKTGDGGLTFTSFNLQSNAGSRYMFEAIDSSTYIYYGDTALYYTTDRGTNWKVRKLVFPGGQKPFNNSYYGSFTDLKTGFIWTHFNYPNASTPYAELNIFTTNDSCKTFKLSYTKKYPYAWSISSNVKILSKTEALLTIGNKLVRTDDFGLTWDTIYTDADTALNFYGTQAKGQYVFVGAYKGRIVVSEDKGKTFKNFNLPVARDVYGISIAATTPTLVAYCITNSDVIYKTSQIVSVDELPADLKPDAQLYPNPFTGDLHVSLTLQKDAAVCMDVYSIYGEKLGSIYNGSLQAGAHVVPISINDQALATGLYMLRITANGASPLTLRMVKVE